MAKLNGVCVRRERGRRGWRHSLGSVDARRRIRPGNPAYFPSGRNAARGGGSLITGPVRVTAAAELGTLPCSSGEAFEGDGVFGANAEQDTGRGLGQQRPPSHRPRQLELIPPRCS